LRAAGMRPDGEAPIRTDAYRRNSTGDVRVSLGKSNNPATKGKTMKRYLIPLILFAAGTLAACSSGSAPTGSPPSSSPASAGTSVAASSTAAATSTAGGASADGTPPAAPPSKVATSGTAAGSTADCAEGQLRTSIDPRDVPGSGTQGANGATKEGVIVDFQNISSKTCVLLGYPGAATVSAAGAQVTQATRTLRGELGGLPAGTPKIPAISLAPGHYAAAMIEGVDLQKAGAAQAGCADSLPRILVTPPNTRTSVSFDVSWPACFSFDVHPVTALPDAP